MGITWTIFFGVNGQETSDRRSGRSRPEVLNRKRPKDECLMGTNTKTTATKATGFRKIEVPQAIQDYNNKFIEFAQANTNAAFDFIQKLSAVKSPSAFVELSTEHARKQLETLTEQTKQLAALAQKLTL
jgi:Phasin protein